MEFGTAQPQFVLYFFPHVVISVVVFVVHVVIAVVVVIVVVVVVHPWNLPLKFG